MYQGPTPPGVILFWGPMWGALSSACRKREKLHVAMWPLKKVEIYFGKICFVDCKWADLNVPGSWCHSLLEGHFGVPFTLYCTTELE